MGGGISEFVGTSKEWLHGAKSSISTTATQLSTNSTKLSTPLSKGVLVKAASTNSGKLYVGLSDVTNGSADATDGFELSSGESIFIETDRLDRIYVIASASSQKAFWAAV